MLKSEDRMHVLDSKQSTYPDSRQTVAAFFLNYHTIFPIQDSADTAPICNMLLNKTLLARSINFSWSNIRKGMGKLRVAHKEFPTTGDSVSISSHPNEWLKRPTLQVVYINSHFESQLTRTCMSTIQASNIFLFFFQTIKKVIHH